MINLIKNKKGTILPVTIVSMFIMILIAFSCIKMFLVQNVMSTTDQLKVRTFYAAEGAIERKISRIYKYIRDINENSNIKIGKETLIDDYKIDKLETTGSIAKYKNFKDGNLSNVVYNDTQFVTEDNMYPNINTSVSITLFDSQTWLNDCGVNFYAQKGVNKTPTALYGDFIELNSSVYDDVAKLEYVDNGWAKKKKWMAFVNITGSDYSYVDLKDDSNIIEKSEGHVLNVAKVEAVKSKMGNYMYPNGINTPIYFCVYKVEYYVRHTRKGYLISSSADAEISHKIPTVTCNMKLYFDIFLTKLYRKFVLSKVYKAEWKAATSTDPAHWHWSEVSAPNVTRYEFLDDSNKYINNVKFHIQKWEVLN